MPDRSRTLAIVLGGRDLPDLARDSARSVDSGQNSNLVGTELELEQDSMNCITHTELRGIGDSVGVSRIKRVPPCRTP
jgi:hypothetical protein